MTPRRDIVETAVAKGLFAKAARLRVVLPADLAGEVERLLRERCLALLGLARRAGQLRTGFEKVREDLKAGRAACCWRPAMGRPTAAGKLAALAGDLARDRAVRQRGAVAALGVEGVVHAWLPRGGIAAALLREFGAAAGDAGARISSRTEI